MMAQRRAGGRASLTQIGRELEGRPDQLRAWVRETHGTGTGPTGETPEQELRRLRREVATLRQEQAFAKKVAADSTGQSNSLCKNSCGCAKAEGFAWACVELRCNMIQIALGVYG